MPVKLSYINARGEEAILDDDEGTFAHELQGRDGFEFPTIDLTEHEYGDGSTDVVAITVKNREVTCYFWADSMDIPHWEDKFDDVKAILLQTGQKESEWGKLKIRLMNGQYVFLNCVYSKGIDSLVRDNMNRVKFALTFKATDPYFYDGYGLSYTIKQDDRSGYLFMSDAVLVGTQNEAREITGEQTIGTSTTADMWWRVSIDGQTLYYTIYPAETRTLYFREAQLFDTKADAIAYCGESEESEFTWKTISNYKETATFTSLEDAQAFGGTTRTYTEGGVTKYYCEKTSTKYYAISKRNSLYMTSSNANTGDDIYIQSEKVYPEIEINGPAENIVLTSKTTGRKIELSSSIVLDVNEKINIITTPLKRKITMTNSLGQVTNLIPYLSADSTLDWWLSHGTNGITFNNSATTPETYLSFKYVERRASIQ